MLKTWQEFNGAYKGRTVFIVGAGGSLVDFEKDFLAMVAEHPSIGLNAVPYICPTQIFLSAYIAMCILAQKGYERRGIYAGRAIVNMKLGRVRYQTCTEGFVRVQRQRYKRALGLPQRFGTHGPIIYTSKNAALAASHLAYILGAKRIVYVGVTMLDQVHFYHADQRYAVRIWEDVMKVSRKCPRQARMWERLKKQFDIGLAQRMAIFGFKHPYLSEHLLENVREVFRDYFAIFKTAGMKVYTVDCASVVQEAGAEYVTASEVSRWED